MNASRVTQITAAALLATIGGAAYAQTSGGPQPGAASPGQPNIERGPSSGGGVGGMTQPNINGQPREQQPSSPGQQPRRSQSTDKGASDQNADRTGTDHKREDLKRGAAQKDKDDAGKSRTGERSTGEGPRTGAGGGVGSRPALSTEQRANVRHHLRGGPSTNVNISISVGSRLPREVRPLPLPAAVIEIVPEYRGYYYVLVRDEILIVDPKTLFVVAVIEA